MLGPRPHWMADAIVIRTIRKARMLMEILERQYGNGKGECVLPHVRKYSKDASLPHVEMYSKLTLRSLCCAASCFEWAQASNLSCNRLISR